MAYETHLKVTWSGYLGGNPGPEIWSTGLQLQIPADFAGLPTVGQTNGILAAFRGAFVLSGDAAIGEDAYLTSQKVALIGPDGKVVVDGSGAFVQRVTGSTGQGNAGVKHPWQIANVLTLVTSRHGPRGKGRMYLPAPNFPVLADGRIDPSLQGACLSAWAIAISDINAACAADGAVGPFSVAVASSMGETHVVTDVRMGRVLDTQRRRRDNLEESYQTVTI